MDALKGRREAHHLGCGRFLFDEDPNLQRSNRMVRRRRRLTYVRSGENRAHRAHPALEDVTLEPRSTRWPRSAPWYRTFLLLALMSIVATRAGGSSESPLWLELRVTTSETVYSIDDSMVLRFEVRNRGKESVAFQDDFVVGLPGTLRYEVVDQERNPIEQQVFFCPLFAYLASDEPRMVVLRPGEVVGHQLEFDVRSFVPSEGRYTITFRYLARKDRESYLGRPVWNRETGPLFGSLILEVRKTQ